MLTAKDLTFLHTHCKNEASLKALIEHFTALYEKELYYCSIVELQSEPICRYGADTLLTYVNPAFCRHFKTTAEALIGSSFIALIPEYDRENAHRRVHELFYLLKRTRVMDFPHEIEGKTVWYQWTDTPILDDAGNVTEVQAVGVEVTERYLAEQHKLDLLVEQERSHLLIDFIEQLYTQLTDPLTTLKISLSSLLHAIDPNLTESIVRRALRQTNHILSLFETATHLMQLDVYPILKRSPQRIQNMVHDVLVKYEIDIQFRHLKVIQEFAPNLPLVPIDAAKMMEVLSQVVDNAIKFSEHGRTLWIRVYQKHPSQVIIEVEDQGKGMLSFEIPKIFMRFYRGRGSEGVSGFGLGLAMVEKIVKLHEGEIAVESEVGKGTLFRMMLPVYPHGELIKRATETHGPDLSDDH